MAFWGALGFVEAHRYADVGYLIVRHPMGVTLHFGLVGNDFDPLANGASAYLRCTTGDEAVALYEEWAEAVPADGEIHPPVDTWYGLVEWPILDPDRNLLRIGGRPDG